MDHHNKHHWGLDTRDTCPWTSLTWIPREMSFYLLSWEPALPTDCSSPSHLVRTCWPSLPGSPRLSQLLLLSQMRLTHLIFRMISLSIREAFYGHHTFNLMSSLSHFKAKEKERREGRGWEFFFSMWYIFGLMASTLRHLAKRSLC